MPESRYPVLSHYIYREKVDNDAKGKCWYGKTNGQYGEKERVTHRLSFVALQSATRSLCGASVDGKQKVTKKQRRSKENGLTEK
jgi:hypothetical protein